MIKEDDLFFLTDEELELKFTDFSLQKIAYQKKISSIDTQLVGLKEEQRKRNEVKRIALARKLPDGL